MKKKEKRFLVEETEIGSMVVDRKFGDNSPNHFVVMCSKPSNAKLIAEIMEKDHENKEWVGDDSLEVVKKATEKIVENTSFEVPYIEKDDEWRKIAQENGDFFIQNIKGKPTICQYGDYGDLAGLPLNTACALLNAYRETAESDAEMMSMFKDRARFSREDLEFLSATLFKFCDDKEKIFSQIKDMSEINGSQAQRIKISEFISLVREKVKELKRKDEEEHQLPF